MSFILDALRKSENERQQQATPGIADVRYTRPQTARTRWLLAIIVVLVLNALLIGFLLLRDEAPTPADARVVQERPVPPAPAAPDRRPAQVPLARDDVRPLAEEVPSEESPPAAPTVAPSAATPPPAGRPRAW